MLSMYFQERESIKKRHMIISTKKMRKKTSPMSARTFLQCSNGKRKLRDALKPTRTRTSFQLNDKKMHMTNIMVDNFKQAVSFTCNIIYFCNIYCSTIPFYNDITCI